MNSQPWDILMIKKTKFSDGIYFMVQLLLRGVIWPQQCSRKNLNVHTKRTAQQETQVCHCQTAPSPDWLKICPHLYSKWHLAVNPDVKNNETLIRSISTQYLTACKNAVSAWTFLVLSCWSKGSAVCRNSRTYSTTTIVQYSICMNTDVFGEQRWQAETVHCRWRRSVIPVWLTLSWKLSTPAAITSSRWSRTLPPERDHQSRAGAPPCWMEVQQQLLCSCLSVQHLYVLNVMSHVLLFSSTHLSSVCTVPPSNVTIVPGNTSFNLTWVPGERDRNQGFHFEYLKEISKMHKFSAGELLKRIGVVWSVDGI